MESISPEIIGRAIQSVYTRAGQCQLVNGGQKMELMGIKFAPLHVPLEKRLQTLAVGAAMAVMYFSGLFGTILLIYLIFYTHYWPLAAMYLIWAYVIDVNSGENGGRRSEWVRNWEWWKYYTDYYPIKLEKMPGVELDPKRNYCFCCFPHGILPTAVFSAFVANRGGFSELFPHHTSYPVTVRANLLMPMLREILLALGTCISSQKSLDWILGSPDGGKAAALVVGGAAETFNCLPGEYRILLKKRKGFVKLALRHGTPLIPVFSFGETDIYHHIHFPKGSIVRSIQEWIKDVTGVAPVIFYGRGFFQYSFGIIPYRKPIFTIVGKPIEVDKVEHPTQEQIDSLHQEFINQLMKLFEEQKHKYVVEAQKTTLVIE